MVKALVMGAAGELGSHFVTGLLERGIPNSGHCSL